MTANPTIDQALNISRAQRTDETVRLLSPATTARTISFGRLLTVEVRKLVDTITGRVLLAIIAAITVAIAVVHVAWFNSLSAGGWSLATGTVGFGATLLLPILGILLATQEWTQRTALTTFTIEPRRGRVLAAKILVALGCAVTTFVVVIALTIVAFVLGSALNNVPMVWATEWETLFGALGVLGLNTLMGIGFGMLLMNTPAAIVSYMALPTVMPLFSMINQNVAKVMTWIDPSQAWAPLMGESWTGESIAKFAVSVSILIVLPLTAGIIRQVRREVK